MLLPDDYRANENFRFHRRFFAFLLLIEKCGWVLADLGVSSHQLMMAERGFLPVFRLDMRMSQKMT
jgi:16S rRNA C1402 N4-methylase RsmH